MFYQNKVRQILTDIEGYVDDSSGSVYENVVFVAVVSVVLAVVSAFETYSLNRVSLTGLPLSALRESFAPPVAAGIAFICVIVGSVVLLLVGSAALHVFAVLLGARKGFSETVPAMVSFMVPNLLLGWVPFVNIWTSIYTFLIIVYVLAKKQDISMARATLAIAIPILIWTGLIVNTGMTRAGLVQTLIPVPGI